MTRHPFADAGKIVLSLFAGPIAVALLAFGLVATLSYCAGSRQTDAKVVALRDTPCDSRTPSKS